MLKTKGMKKILIIIIMLMSFGATAQYNMTVDTLFAEGAIGIGTFAPKSILDVGGRISISNTGNSVFIGEDAGLVDDLGSNYNTLIGYYAGKANISGGFNVFVGGFAGEDNTSAVYNTFVGYQSGKNTTIGNSNTMIGEETFTANTEGEFNVGVGRYSLNSNTVADYNTAIGSGSLQSITTGEYNLGLGYQAGRYYGSGASSNQTATNGIYIGKNARASANGQTNEIAIGTEAIANGSNTVTLGDDNVTDVYLNENGTAILHASKLGTSGIILDGSDSLIDANAVYDYVALSGNGLVSVDASNISQVAFRRAADTIYESFAHVHTEYALQSQIAIINDSLAIHLDTLQAIRIDINKHSDSLAIHLDTLQALRIDINAITSGSSKQFSQTNTVTVTNTTSATTILGTGVGSATLSANSLAVGDVVSIHQSGVITNSTGSGENLTIKMMLGLTSLGSASGDVTLGASDWEYSIDVKLTVRSIGAGGTVMFTGFGLFEVRSATNTWTVIPLTSTSAISINTTANQAIDIQAQWATASLSLSVSSLTTVIEVLK